MKQITLMFLSFLMLGFSAMAQKTTDKIVLKEGQVVNMTTDMKSDIKQAQRGDMKTDMTLVSSMKVSEINDKGYVLEATMNKARMNFEGFGMKQEYDSEDKDKKEGMMAKAFEKVLGKSENVLLGFDGKVIVDPADASKKKGGMMRMMGGADIASTIEGVFLLLPEDLEVGKKWRTTTEKEGLKVITEYTYKGMMGNMANLTANQQSKGEVESPRATTNVNQLTQMTIMVDAKTGLISMKTSKTNDKSSTEMGGETYKNEGVTSMTITCE